MRNISKNTGGGKGPKNTHTKHMGHHTNQRHKANTSSKQNKGSKNQKSKNISIFFQMSVFLGSRGHDTSHYYLMLLFQDK